MIDISQWRQSIGLWNYCQASSGRPSNRCSLGDDCTVGSTNRKKKGRRSLVLSFIVICLFISILLSGYLNYEPHAKGVVIHCYWSKVQCTSTGHTITDSSYLQSILPGSDVSSSDVFYSSVYLINLLLLSGDVELNPGPLTGNPKDIFRTHSDKLIHAISENLHNVTLALNAKGLITQQIKEDMTVPGASNYEKSSKLVNVIQQILEASLKSHQYLTELCQVLQNQQNHALRNIAASMLGLTIPDDVLSYAHNMKQYYKGLATDEGWKPSDYFGRLTLVEKQDYSTEAESAKYLLMGQVDKVAKLSGNKEIRVEDILRPVDDSPSLRLVIDGPPGIGKTILCHKLLRMWCETLANQHYDLVLYCSLRNSKLATLADLFKDGTFKAEAVDWFSDRAGERLLIIFDGWDELSEQLRQSSLAASIISKDLLDQCSVIVTSRSYASSSLLKIKNLSRHVQVIGFSKVEISTVIIRTLQKDTKLAQELIDEKREDDKKGRHFTTKQTSKDSQLAVNLIKDLSVQDDVQSLCYVPLLCFIVISIYFEEGGHLPTQLYEKFIVQIIKRHVGFKSRHADINLHTLSSLSSLPSQYAKPLQEMCQLAYINLANTRMTFSSHQLLSLSEAVKEDYLGLMTSFIAHDEKYQFLHLRIQEFLAAWWIAKHEEKTEEIVKNHFDDDHFRKCLSFVSKITGTFYFSEEIFKRTLNEADSVQYSVSTAIVQGEAGVGKTCLKSLILSLPYKEKSTSCIEAPCIARYGSDDGKLWTLVTDDEIDEKVIAQLQDYMIRAGQASNESDEDSTSADTKSSHYSTPDDHSAHHQKLTTNNPKQDPVIKPDVNSPIEETVDLHLPEPKKPIESETKEDNDETPITATVSRDASYSILASGKKFNPLEYCKNTCIEKIGLPRQWLYFFDSGGQIQFQKLLLAFMPCPSVLILVVNLSKKLSETASSDIRPNIEGYIKSLKIQDILAQMVSAVASKAQQHKLAKTDSDYIKYSDEKLNVVTVGTYGDKLKDFIKEGRQDIENIKDKQRELHLMLESVSDSYKDSPLIYEIDGRKAYDKSGEFDDGITSVNIEEVSKHLIKQAHKIDVPLRWHYFGVIVRKKAKDSNDLLSRSECEYFGKMLEMQVEEVHSALQFFHELGMLFYYHASPTNDIVFVKLDCLINIIKDVVIEVNNSWNLSLLKKLLNKEKDLCAGKISVEILKSSEAFKVIAKQLFYDNHDICFTKLFELFQHLKIAAEVPGKGQFVMPALLPVKEIIKPPDQKSSCLLFYFKNAVPMGFFCAIVVHLLSFSWQICIAEGNFSNCFTLQLKQTNGGYLKITLVEKLNWIEIRQCKRTDQLEAKTETDQLKAETDRLKTKTDRLEAKMELDKAIDSVMKVLNLNEEQKPSPAFYCPCPIEGEHVATVGLDKSHNSSIECKGRGNGVELSVDMYKDYFSWFFAEEDTVPSLAATPTKRVRAEEEKFKDEKAAKLIKKETQKVATIPDLLLGKKPLKSDLHRLFYSSAAHYSTIGIALGVEVKDLLHSPLSASDKLILVFQRWIDSNKGVTWRKALQVCDGYPDLFGEVKAKVEGFLLS